MFLLTDDKQENVKKTMVSVPAFLLITMIVMMMLMIIIIIIPIK